MTDDEIRTLVRGAIARHLGPVGAPAGAATANALHGATPVEPPAWRAHPSFGRFLLPRDAGDASCLIEPSVRCTHCGFCQSYGH
ncbi:MAG: hypothetical protein AB1635_03160 [Acidobacteriota bacterium]